MNEQTTLIEIAISNQILTSRQALRGVQQWICENRETKSLQKEAPKEFHMNILHEAHEAHITTYNQACEYYYFDRVDKRLFIERYCNEIKNIVEKDNLYKSYDKKEFKYINKFYEDNCKSK